MKIEKKLIFVSLALVIVLFFVSCRLVSPKIDTFTAQDTNKTIHVSLNDSFNISLDSSPTTGYSWEILPYDESVIKFLKSEFKPTSNKRGSNGKRIIEFKALGKGKTILELFYLRVWEKDKNPIKKFRVTAVVE